jgi:predicted DNA-binding protein (UPF0251 family)
VCFEPLGPSLEKSEEVVLSLDEFEAIRLADLEGLYQEQAAEQMGISRPTFSRIVESAHRKLAEMIVFGRALKIVGGQGRGATGDIFVCPRCTEKNDASTTCPRCLEAAAHGTGPGGSAASPCCPKRRRKRGCGD